VRLGIGILVLLLLPPLAGAVTYTSQVRQTPLIELFTSQGCSSCPPADRWLTSLLSRPGLWQEFIPLAFHVDYWDSLGWKDRFADPANTRRQQRYQRTGAIGSVYTPGFVVAGREWRGFFGGREPRLKPGAEVGRLSLEVGDAPAVRVRFRPVSADPSPQLHLHLARLGFGLKTSVNDGENAGRELHGDFVVLGRRDRLVNSAERDWTLQLPAIGGAEPRRQALVVWVSEGDSPAPLQAVGGWLPGR
jgi:hypothetical protein